jgi:3-oxoacyl-[acyl-carrier protein] reductase
VDILVNVAGGVVGQTHTPIDELTDEAWNAVIAANLTTTMNCTRAAARTMKRRRYGRIIMISSGAGRGVSLTGIQAYTAAKAGQIGFTRQMAHELGPFGITVNCIAPGFVLSNPTTQAQWDGYGEEGQRALVESIDVRRIETPETSPAVWGFRRARRRVGQRSGDVHRRRTFPLLMVGEKGRTR